LIQELELIINVTARGECALSCGEDVHTLS